MDISIIICTYNRSENLKECFDCLASQEITHGFSWEVILVDNNSSDQTKEYTKNYEKNCNFLLRYDFELKQGLSHARNHGIKTSNGDILIFIDDDIRVSIQWLQSIYNTFKAHQCDAVGGRIHIESESNLPKWIKPDMYGFLGHQDFGNTPHQMDGYAEFPFGGNMAIHRSVFEKIGLFNTELGRKGTGLKKEELFKGEETEFFERLAYVNGTFYYEPKALVMHKILAHQLKPSFFLILHNNAGILESSKDKKQYTRTLKGVPLFVFLQFIQSIKKYLQRSIKKKSLYSVRQLMNIAYFWGMICGYYQKNGIKNYFE